MSTLRLSDVLVTAFLPCCIATTQVSCQETELYVVNNETIATRDTRVLNAIAAISFIQCVCLRNTSTCSTKADAETSFGPTNPPTPCNIIDVEPNDITYRKSSGILTQCGRETSRTFITFIPSNDCTDRCLVIIIPYIDRTIQIKNFVNASKECTDLRSKISNLMTPPTYFITTTKKIPIFSPITLTTATTAANTTTQANATTVSPKAAGSISLLTVIISCSIPGILAVVIITCIVVIMKRKKSKKRILANSKKRTPLEFGSAQDSTYNRPNYGYDHNEDVHTYKQVQPSSYANENRSGIQSPVAYTNMNYSVPNQAGVSYNYGGHSKKTISSLSGHEGDGAYIEIIDDSVASPGKLPVYLGIYDKPEEKYMKGSSIYAPVVSSTVTNHDLGHQYLSLKLSDSDSYYIDALSIQTFRKEDPK